MVTISKKMCMVGDFGVGKTSLIRRFVERQFSDRYLSTVGVKISRKVLPLDPDQQKEMKLIIWDIEGQTKFKAIAPTYLQGSSGVLLVADVTREETMEHIADHRDKFLQVCPDGKIAIALNKIDLVDPEEIDYLKQQLQFNHPSIIGTYYTSAKTGDNVDEIFETLAHTMI